MRVVGWTRDELNSADPEDVARIMWVLDAERVAKIAERLDEAAAFPLPDSGPARAKAMLDMLEVSRTRDEIDRYLGVTGDDDG